MADFEPPSVEQVLEILLAEPFTQPEDGLSFVSPPPVEEIGESTAPRSPRAIAARGAENQPSSQSLWRRLMALLGL
jgi:hypothetical protein